MELWVLIAIGAAFLQNLRSALQKQLRGRLSNGGVTFSRFVFALPLIGAFLWVLVAGYGYDIPRANVRFAGFVVLGGVAQIGATALLVHLFGLRNFTVGTTFSKTETIQAALFGVVLLHDTISAGAVIALFVGLAGVVLISAPQGFGGQMFNRAAAVGIASGAGFAIAGVSYRAASLALESGDFLIRASVTLFAVLSFQTLVMTLWLRWREAGQIGRVLASWRIAALAGIAGGLASLGWFSAMTLQNAAYVKAVGQVELLFSFAASLLFFGETFSKREVLGILLVSAGILALLFFR